MLWDHMTFTVAPARSQAYYGHRARGGSSVGATYSGGIGTTLGSVVHT